MKILIVCDEGLNRSATIRGRLQYWGHDILTVGLKRNDKATIAMLCEWSDVVILTAKDQRKPLEQIALTTANLRDHSFQAKCDLWDIGPDVYSRPYNTDLLKKVEKLIDEHKDEYKPKK